MELTQLLIDAQNARSRNNECRQAAKDAQYEYDRLRRESWWIDDPVKYRECVDALNVADRAYNKASKAAKLAEQDFNEALAALLDFNAEDED
jgi:hypothetical protein